MPKGTRAGDSMTDLENRNQEELLAEYHTVATELEAGLSDTETHISIAKQLEARLDTLGDLLGFCDLNDVADHLIKLAVEDLGPVTAGKRHEDPRRRYKGVCVRPEKRLAIYLRDHFTCAYCGKDLHGAKASNITLDHVMAHAIGGSQDPRNLVMVCRSCNSRRKDMPLRKFVDSVPLNEVRKRTRRSYNRYHALAKALLAQQFTIKDIREEKIYLRHSSTNGNFKRFILTASFCELRVQVLRRQYDDYDVAEDRAVVGTTDLRLVCDVSTDVTIHWTTIYSRYGQLRYESYELDRLTTRDQTALIELLAATFEEDVDDVERRRDYYIKEMLGILNDSQRHEGVEIIPNDLMWENESY